MFFGGGAKFIHCILIRSCKWHKCVLGASMLAIACWASSLRYTPYKRCVTPLYHFFTACQWNSQLTTSLHPKVHQENFSWSSNKQHLRVPCKLTLPPIERTINWSTTLIPLKYSYFNLPFSQLWNIRPWSWWHAIFGNNVWVPFIQWFWRPATLEVKQADFSCVEDYSCFTSCMLVPCHLSWRLSIEDQQIFILSNTFRYPNLQDFVKWSKQKL